MNHPEPSPDGIHAALSGLVAYLTATVLDWLHRMLESVTGVERPAYWRGDKT